ncbi:MAG: ABC transporter substrate-binding protein [Paracoccaceae bacterium]
MHKNRWSGASALALTALLAGAADAQNVLRWSSQGDALTLDPHSQNEGPTIAMNGQIYESLVTRDADLELQPELATSWEGGEEGWVFTLRQGVKFHDGSDFTAEDVAFSFGRAQAPASDYKEQVKSITDVEIIDDYTVRLITNGPNPILPNELTSLYMMDSEWATTNNVETPQDYAAKEETFAVRNANGTGPFRVVSRAPDELTVLEANTDWWGKGEFPGNIDRIEYRPIKNPATRVAALLSGELDFVLDPPLQDLARIEGASGLHVTTVAQIRSIFLGMDMASAELRSSDVKGKNPFQEQKVRLAVNHALDKEAIKRVVMEDLSFPTGMITPPGVLGNTPELDEPYAFDTEMAKSLLAEAGYADGFTVQLDCPNDRYNNDEKICQAVVAMLAKIGIKVNLEAVSKSQHFPKIQNRESDFYMLGWGVPTLDSHYAFAYLVEGGGSWNATGYDNARVNAITQGIATEIDVEKRTALIDEAWHIVKEEAPYAPIHHQVIAWGISDDFEIPIASDDAFRPRFVVKK